MDKKEKEKELQKIVSLTFDESPKVRKEAALKLAESDEPAALFALLELSYDKDESVKAAAREILSKKPSTDKDVISFAEIFGAAAEKEAVAQPMPADDLKKRKLLSPVEQIFEKKLGKAKAALVKDRMMPTIEKIYMNAVGSKPDDSQKRERSIQRMLTSYADVLSGLDKLMFEDRHVRAAEMAEVRAIRETPAKHAEEPSAVLEEVGTRADTSKIARDLSGLEEEEEEISREIPSGSGSADRSVFRKAYDIMMASEGDEEMMYQQSQRLVKQLQDDVNLAFRLAKQRFRAENITHLTELRNGMRNVNTDLLVVKSAERGEYPRTKTKKDSYARIIMNDSDGSEGIIYLFEGRGSEVRSGMKIKVVKGQVKTFAFSGETAITIGKKGNVYVVL